MQDSAVLAIPAQIQKHVIELVRDAQIMPEDAHDETRVAFPARTDVEPEQRDWCSRCENPLILNRLVSHPTDTNRYRPGYSNQR